MLWPTTHQPGPPTLHRGLAGVCSSARASPWGAYSAAASGRDAAQPLKPEVLTCFSQPQQEPHHPNATPRACSCSLRDADSAPLITHPHTDYNGSGAAQKLQPFDLELEEENDLLLDLDAHSTRRWGDLFAKTPAPNTGLHVSKYF